MNLQQLRYVKALVDEGSFVGAAARCAVTQPTLSNGIAQLEAELGSRLFRRTTRSLRLTPYGENLLPSILEALRSFDNLTAISKSGGAAQSCSIHVGLSPIVGISRAETALSRFKTKHPETNVIYKECNFRDLCGLMQRRELDIILSPWDMSLEVEADYMTIALENDQLMFIPRRSDRHIWENVDNVTLPEIANETFVLVPDACGLTSRTKSLFLSNNLILKKHAGEASSYSAIQEWARLGLGAGILPKSRLLDDGTINIPIVHNGHPLAIEYFAIGRPQPPTSQIFAHLWDSLLEVKIILQQTIQAATARDRQLRLTKSPI